jgi:hypothetical protein
LRADNNGWVFANGGSHKYDKSHYWIIARPDKAVNFRLTVDGRSNIFKYISMSFKVTLPFILCLGSPGDLLEVADQIAQSAAQAAQSAVSTTCGNPADLTASATDAILRVFQCGDVIAKWSGVQGDEPRALLQALNKLLQEAEKDPTKYSVETLQALSEVTEKLDECVQGGKVSDLMFALRSQAEEVGQLMQGNLELTKAEGICIASGIGALLCNYVNDAAKSTTNLQDVLKQVGDQTVSYLQPMPCDQLEAGTVYQAVDATHVWYEKENKKWLV